MAFKEISYKDLNINPMTLFGDEWGILAAGDEHDSNAMTIAWGELGSLWEHGGHRPPMPVATVYVRPNRYTHDFMEREDTFSISFLKEGHRRALGYMGSHSGRDGDKYQPAGITPVYGYGTTYFEEAKLVLVCNKVYTAPIVEDGFVDRSLIKDNYPLRDYHTMYVGEITHVLEA